jgi:protein TonB
MAGVAVVVPALLAVGVIWLRQMSANPRAQYAIMEVRLLSGQERADQPQHTSPPNGAAAMLSEPTVDRRESSEVDAAARSTPPHAVATVSPAAPVVAVSSLSSLAQTSRTALVFQKALLTHIARFRLYPENARRAGLQGTVQMLFAMRRDGMVTDVHIRTSSGERVLDEAAAETIRRAQPLPRIPRELPDRLTILVPVEFGLL